MKFLCDNCKAKYQIADEKVAGKTVRMKCRKCGHQIEVRAAVTETSTASAAPRPPGGMRPAPRAGGLATSLSATKPRPSTPSSPPGPGPLASAFQRNVQDAPASLPGSAFGPKSATIELSVTDEWYVAINGVPVGPVRISELRRKAAVGAVTEESLCWQEGLEEWRPIRSIPELAAIVREAAQGNRPSLITSPDVAPRTSVPSAPRQPVAPRASVAPPRPNTPSQPSRSNVVPLRPATSPGLDDHSLGAPSGAVALASAPSQAVAAAPLAPAPFAATPAPLAPMFTPQPVPLSLPPPTIDPFAVPPAPGPGQPPYRDSVLPPVHPSFPPPAPAPLGYVDPNARKPGVPLWFWPILLLALGFGGGVAFVVFSPKQQPAPVVIQMPQPTAQPTAAPTPDKVDTPPPANSTDPAPVATETKPKAVASKGAKAPPPSGEEKKGLDLGGLVGSSGGGPNVGPNPGAGPSGGGGLDQAGVERTVANHRAGVKRTCWERGGADQKSSVNVMVTANVAPNGTVASTSSSGDDPVVGKCIESQVKSWTFPAPGSPTTINIPFKFVRQ
jgi:predicted Zn finger-like uncharacterized protein